jgi:O-antigen ligase
MFVESNSKATALISRIAVGVFALCNIMTFGRVGIAVLGITCVLWLLLKPNKLERIKRDTKAFMIKLAVSGAAMVVLGVVFLPEIIERQLKDFSGLGEYRPEINAKGISEWMNHFWAGVGPNQFKVYMGTKDSVMWQNVHSFFIELGVNVGFIGAVLIFLPIIVTLALSLVNVYKTSGQSIIGRTALCLSTAFLLFTLFDTQFIQKKYITIFILFGWFMALNVMEYKKNLAEAKHTKGVGKASMVGKASVVGGNPLAGKLSVKRPSVKRPSVKSPLQERPSVKKLLPENSR